MKMLRMALLSACACIAMLAPTAYAHDDNAKAAMSTATAPTAAIDLPVASDSSLDALCISITADKTLLEVAYNEPFVETEAFALKVSMSAVKHTESFTLAMNDVTGNRLLKYRQ